LKTIFAVFREYEGASEAVDALSQARQPDYRLNLIVEESVAKDWIADLDFNRAKVEKSAEAGEGKIRGLDAMLAGRQPVRVPDVGAVYSAGELASMIAQTAAAPGATDSGLSSSLQGFGVPEETAKTYVDEINGGSALFILRTEDERAPEAVRMLTDGGALRVDSFPR